jgi:hypothetical protein
MSIKHPPLWIGFTLVLTIIFILLFSTAIVDEYGIIKTTFFTLLGVIVIWIVYFIRANIFSKMGDSNDKLTDET